RRRARRRRRRRGSTDTRPCSDPASFSGIGAAFSSGVPPSTSNKVSKSRFSPATSGPVPRRFGNSSGFSQAIFIHSRHIRGMKPIERRSRKPTEPALHDEKFHFFSGFFVPISCLAGVESIWLRYEKERRNASEESVEKKESEPKMRVENDRPGVPRVVLLAGILMSVAFAAPSKADESDSPPETNANELFSGEASFQDDAYISNDGIHEMKAIQVGSQVYAYYRTYVGLPYNNCGGPGAIGLAI